MSGRVTVIGLATSLLLYVVGAIAEPVDVYLLSGQSNMQGSGNLNELDAKYREPIPEAMFWNGTTFEPVTPGTTKVSSSAERFGPELQFARRLAQANPGEKFYIIKYYASGQPLDHGMSSQEWHGDNYGPGRSNFYGGENDADPNMGTRYRGMINMMRAALTHLDEKKIEYTVRGFLWMQGEADSKHEVPAESYAQNLQFMHGRLMDDLGVAPCPLVFGQALPYSPPAPRFTHRDEVRESMANADHASGHPESYQWAHMVSTDGVALKEDTVHYSSEGLIELGDRFYEALTEARK